MRVCKHRCVSTGFGHKFSRKPLMGGNEVTGPPPTTSATFGDAWGVDIVSVVRSDPESVI